MKSWPGWTRSPDGDALRHESGAQVLVRARHPTTKAPTRVQWFCRGDWGTTEKISEAVERVQARLEKGA